ncbi:MAG: DUF2934 domain-containing protein [Deltaproteobacteria bacterium]|nr:DUF2934 domain-containing protein [Deltaproteobacteria bacterium]
MTIANEAEVRERAYYIWEREGRPQGRELQHWQAALRELSLEVKSTNGAGSKSTGPRAPRKSRIGSMVAKAKDALDGTPTAAKPAARKRKQSTKANSDPSKRSPQAP